ncbi:MAG: Rrf2 family transcriptional regulator [Balneolaceae bacterium]|nr:MAG: Rrf2 family transcriptional regulator [Balneolaceae bacterium]
MLLSKSCMYGLRASVQLAGMKGNTYVTIRELSEDLDISFFFLTKVLQRLTQAEILESYKGPNGGVRLLKHPGEVTFLDVVTAIDGSCTLSECALGLPGCGVMKPCPLHDQWSILKENILEMMQNVTIAELARRNSGKQGLDGFMYYLKI